MKKLILLTLLTLPFAPFRAFALEFETVKSIFGSGNSSFSCVVNAQSFNRCKIDTGSVFSSVREDLLKTPGEFSHSVPMMSFSGQFVDCSVTLNNSVDLGVGVKDEVLLLVCPKLKASNVDVIIGLDLLSQGHFSIDYQTQELILEPPQIPEPHFDLTISDSGHLIVEVVAGRTHPVSTQALFDTGAGLSLVDWQFVARHPENFTIINDNSVVDTHGNRIVSQLVLGKALKLGSREFVIEYFMAVDLSAARQSTGRDIDFILGHNLIKNAGWAFDPGQGLWSNWIK